VKAVGGFFLRGYLAWKRGEQSQARALLENARLALGKDWQPKGATSEGDVRTNQHIEATPLTRYWNRWDGETDPDRTFLSLAEYLKTLATEQAPAVPQMRVP
jgi:hypothetical protein